MSFFKTTTLAFISLGLLACDDGADEGDAPPPPLDQGVFGFPDGARDEVGCEAGQERVGEAGCRPSGDAEVDATPPDATPPDAALPDAALTPPTWEEPISPLFNQRCVRCHRWLRSYSGAVGQINGVRVYTERSHFIRGDEQQITLDWIADGYPER